MLSDCPGLEKCAKCGGECLAPLEVMGPLTEEDDYGLCTGCHEYPCCCTADPECNCHFSGDQADASDCDLHGNSFRGIESHPAETPDEDPF